MTHNKEVWDQCERYLNAYLASGYADVALKNKCKNDSEKRFCIDYLHNQKISSNLQPEESISGLEEFLNEQ
jgi:hypothetical protein